MFNRWYIELTLVCDILGYDIAIAGRAIVLIDRADAENTKLFAACDTREGNLLAALFDCASVEEHTHRGDAHESTQTS